MRFPIFSLFALTTLTGLGVEAFNGADVSLDDVQSNTRYLNQKVRVRGTVAEIFHDSIDTNFVHMFLTDGRALVDAAFQTELIDKEEFSRLLNAEVEVVGGVILIEEGWRKRAAPFVNVTEPLRILKAAPADPFEAADIEKLQPDERSKLRQYARYRIDGQVRAAWKGGNLLVETPQGLTVHVHLAHDVSPPGYGETIRAVGIIDTDAANILLTSAVWRRNPMPRLAEQTPVTLDARSFSGTPSPLWFKSRPVTVTAVLRDVSGGSGAFRRLTVSVGDETLFVDSGNRPELFDGLRPGSVLRLTGVPLLETEPWSHRTPFPHVTGHALILRTPGDLVVLRQPPWWTVGRLLAVVGVLLALMAAVLAWNVALRRLVERRGRLLYREQLAHAKSAMQTEERTRLAVELHDSLSQTLTGVSMEIAAASDLKGDADDAMSLHLARAERTLKSCRDELRNCLWDLRSEALDAPDMTEAVRQTLRPHIDGQQLAVRFGVPRARLSDNTAHAILRMIRELVVNALRHGKATSVKVAGSLDADKLNFSVRDNGCGFDPENCPGVLQGHFGLQGIRERLGRLGGSLTVTSAPGHGTVVIGRIPTPSLVGVSSSPSV